MTDQGPSPLPPTWVGPWLQTALFCERAIIDTEGVLTVVRMVDRAIRTVEGTRPPREMAPFEHSLWLVISLKPGEARGRGALTLVMEAPNGLRRQVAEQAIHLEGSDRGANLVSRVMVRFELEGLHWFDVLYDGQLLTRMPYRVMYQPKPVGPRG